jgi:nucleotide-binding universal stress UspA family protein
MAGMGEKYPDVHVTTRVAQGAPEQVLADASERMDLVVVGAHQKGRLSRAFFGSVSVYVVEHARCPVAVVPLATAS